MFHYCKYFSVSTGPKIKTLYIKRYGPGRGCRLRTPAIPGLYQHMDGRQLSARNGVFSFQGLLAGPSTAWIEYKENNKMIFLEPSTMTFDANKDWSDVKVSGSKTQNDYQVLDTELRKIERR